LFIIVQEVPSIVGNETKHVENLINI